MADKGWIVKWALGNKCLAADEVGRSAMEDGYVIMRMLDKSISAKLSKIGTLEKRLKALEKAIAEITAKEEANVP